MTRRPPGQSERSRMRRRVRTFATTIAKELRDEQSGAFAHIDEYTRGWNDALEYAARLLEQRAK